MSLKEKVYNYFKQDQKRSYRIEQFEETIFFTPVTVLELEKIRTLSQDGGKDFAIWTIIEKAQDEAGNKIFGLEDKPFLEKLPWRVVSDIAGAINGALEIEAVKKT